MTKISLGDLLRARESGLELKKLDKTLEQMLEATKTNDAAHHDLKLVIEFFTKAVDLIESAILGRHDTRTVLLGDSPKAKFNYPVARILGVKNWKEDRAQEINNNWDHPYYQVWYWFNEWCRGNGLVPYLEFCWSNYEDTWWYELGVHPDGD
jgi:hypothetical protein